MLQEIKVIIITKNNNHPVVCEYTRANLIQGSAIVIHIVELALLDLFSLNSNMDVGALKLGLIS